MTIHEKLLHIQSKLKAPKGQYNSFGKYSYRNCEDILEALKPLLVEVKATLVIGDNLQQVGERYYIEAVVSLIDTESETRITTSAYAREEESKKGMDGSQVTGAASSYARKYALNGLFGIDDNKDSDATNKGAQVDEKPKEYKCNDCGKAFAQFVDGNKKTWTAGQVYHMAEGKNSDGKARCNACRLQHEKEITPNA